MILRQPVLQRRRKKEHLVQVAGAEALAHTTSVPDSGTFPYGNVPLCSSPRPQDRIYLQQSPRFSFPPPPRRFQASQPVGRKIVAQCVSTGRTTVPPQPRNGAEEPGPRPSLDRK